MNSTMHFYSLKEVAKILNVTYLTVYRWVQSGKIKSHQFEKQHRIEESDLQLFISECKCTLNLNVLDLFCGAGGLSSGFQKAGFNIVAGLDNWQEALDTFELNHSNALALNEDLDNLDIDSLDSKIKHQIDVVIGGPPCQGFSISGKRNPNDPRNKLYQSFVDIVKHYHPKAFVLENVPNLVSMSKGLIKDEIIKDFELLGYKVQYKILLASDYGVPQNRKRVFFVGLRGKEFQFPKPTSIEHITSKAAINDLPEETIEDGSNYPLPATSDFQRQMRAGSTGIYNHVATQHNEKTIKIISMVPDGGNYKDLPKELWNTRKVNIAWTRINSNKPSMTIDTGHNHHFHYEFNRVPTARESARLQSFEDKFRFLGTKTSQLKQIGNAVPPLLAYELAKQLREQL